MISEATKARFAREVAKYPAEQKQSAVMACLAIVQQEQGHVSEASEAVIAVLHRLISESLPPQRLPRLAFVDGIPTEHRVLVVIPAMLADPQGIKALVRQLELHYLANSENQALEFSNDKAYWHHRLPDKCQTRLWDALPQRKLHPLAHEILP